MEYRTSPLEGVAMTGSFWRGKRVFITGHTGFKGSWLCLWLKKLGADITGYSLLPPTEPSLFNLAGVKACMGSLLGDVRDYDSLLRAVQACRPEIVFHMAAQSLVRRSYQDPVGTLATNIMGTVHLLDAVRHTDSVRVAVNVTSDKCYENKEWVWGYRENDPMGGFDPYSSSKGCSELVTSAYRNSFFNPGSSNQPRAALATVRAGNVIGGGDWADERLVPDIMRSVFNHKPVIIRNPGAIRPWQHVLEALHGYLLLAEKLWFNGDEFAGGWNFGPSDDDVVSVGKLTDRIVKLWGQDARWLCDENEHAHEARQLKLDCSKARLQLGWKPKTTLEDAADWIVEWYRAFVDKQDIRQATLKQIERFEQLKKE